MYFHMRCVCVCGLCALNFLNILGGQSKLFSQEGKPSRALQHILVLTGVEHDGTMSDIVKQTQQLWLRKPGQERWDIEKTIHKNHRELWQEFRNCNLVLEMSPQQKKYDYIVFMGATVQRMQLCFNYLLSLINSGIMAELIVVLSGARPLDENIKELSDLKNITGNTHSEGTTECEAAHTIFAYGIPEDIAEYVAIEYINAPMKLDKDGTSARPTTDDTLIAWKKTNPKPGSCLIISNQPYGQRQELVVQHLLSHDFITDVASSKCDVYETEIAVVLDELARLMYQEHAILSKKSNL